MAINGMGERVLTGRVVSVNEKGFKFEGAGEWLNYSKFAVGIVAPDRNQYVSVTVDKAGFVRSVVSAADAPAPIAGGSDAPMSTRTDKDRTITRLAVLKAAAEFSASKQASSSADVLKIAESWEKWVLREDEPSDLTDAF